MKAIIVDEALKEQFGLYVRKGAFAIGLLVGRQLPDDSKDFILYEVPHTRVLGKKPWKSLEEVTKDALEDSVAQVGKMLVGGIKVCGLYSVSSDNSRKALDTLQRLFPDKLSEGKSLSYLHISTQSSQYSCKNGPPKGQAGSVDLKFQAVASKFSIYSTTVNLDVTLEVPAAGQSGAEEDEKVFFQKLLAAAKKEAHSFEQGVSVVSGSGTLGQVPTLEVDLFAPLWARGDQEDSGAPSRVKRVRLMGAVTVIACVHEKETEQDGIAAVKEDLAKGVRDRVVLLREECAAEREEDDNGEGQGHGESLLSDAIHSGGVLHLPRRVLSPWQDEGDRPSILISDYLLPGEDEAESLQRFRDVLLGGEGDRLFTVVHAEEEGEVPPDQEVESKPRKAGASSSASQAGGTPSYDSAGLRAGATSRSEAVQAKAAPSFLPVVLLLGGVLLLIVAIILGSSSSSSGSH